MTNPENVDPKNFEVVKTRLDEIVESVSQEGLSLDEALTLYEEAVNLGMEASTLLTENLDRGDNDGENS